MMQKFLMRSGGVACGSRAVRAMGDTGELPQDSRQRGDSPGFGPFLSSHDPDEGTDRPHPAPSGHGPPEPPPDRQSRGGAHAALARSSQSRAGSRASGRQAATRSWSAAGVTRATNWTWGAILGDAQASAQALPGLIASTGELPAGGLRGFAGTGHDRCPVPTPAGPRRALSGALPPPAPAVSTRAGGQPSE